MPASDAEHPGTVGHQRAAENPMATGFVGVARRGVAVMATTPLASWVLVVPTTPLVLPPAFVNVATVTPAMVMNELGERT